LGLKRRESVLILSKFSNKLSNFWFVWEDRQKQANGYWIILPKVSSNATLCGIKIDQIYIW